MSEKRRLRLAELLQVDEPLWQQGIVLAGIDEVGRGPLAGPVVAACVVMPSEPLLPWVDDSKKLSEARREAVYEEITEHALFIGLGRAEPEEIDRINIRQATRLAMRRAAEEADCGLFLIDAERDLSLHAPEKAIIHGDALSYHIAAASIVAKVIRDREMRLLDLQYPEYGFSANKGYGTAQHIAALRQYGPCPLHRLSFIGGLQ